MSYESKRAPVAVILATTVGARHGALAETRANCLVSVGGSVVLERMIRNCLSCGISQFVLVLGHRSDEIRQYVDKTFRGIRVTYVINDRYQDTNTAYSLMLAAPAIGSSDYVTFEADVVFEPKILRDLIDSRLLNTLCIDTDIALDDGATKVITDDQMRVIEIGRSVDAASATGRSIGIEKLSAKIGPSLFAELKQMMADAARMRDSHQSAYAQLIDKGVAFHAVDITGSKWTRIDTAEGFAAANVMFGSPVVTVSRGQQRAMDEATAKAPPQPQDI